MSPTKTHWRFFLAHEDPKQEAWFEEQAKKGWHLVKPGLFGFTFVQGEPREARYRLDYQLLSGDAREEYLALFQDAGWELLGHVANRYYFRARPDAHSPEIFTDPESRKDRIKRELRIIGVLLGINALNLSFMGTHALRTLATDVAYSGLIHPVEWVMLFGPVLCGLAVVLLAWCAWKLVRAMNREG